MPEAATVNKNEQASRDKATAKRQSTESKSARFKRIGTKRLKKAVAAIGLMENLGSANYEYSSEQVQQIITRLVTAVQRVETVLTKPDKTAAADDGFSL